MKPVEVPAGRETVLRFGVVRGGSDWPAWQVKCLTKILGIGRARLALIITVDENSGRKSGLFTLVEGIGGKRSAARRPADSSTLRLDAPEMHCRPGPDRTLPPGDIQSIAGYDLDFLLMFTEQPLLGAVLDVTRYGAWFPSGNQEKYGTLPPFLGEIYHQDTLSLATLYGLTSRGALPLRRCTFRTVRESWVKNRDTGLFFCAELAAKACRDILFGSGLNNNGAYVDLDFTPRIPDNLQTAFLLLRLIKNWIAENFKKFFITEKWNVALLSQPIQTSLLDIKDTGARWLPLFKNVGFLADPFVLDHPDSGTLILVEDFDYKKDKATISVVQINNNDTVLHRSVIDLPVHASYPYLLEYNGEYYCIPETCQARQVSLFKAMEFPFRWEKVATLIDSFACVDPTVFFHGDYWWLFCTDGDSNTQTTLCAWYAADLFGPWYPHKTNPLKMDARSSRPGGPPFTYEGHLYRPAQDNSRTYGGRIVVNRVTRLTPSEFAEEEVSSIEPRKDVLYGKGLHTIGRSGNLTVIDGKRLVFCGLSKVNKALRGRLRRLGRG